MSMSMSMMGLKRSIGVVLSVSGIVVRAAVAAAGCLPVFLSSLSSNKRLAAAGMYYYLRLTSS